MAEGRVAPCAHEEAADRRRNRHRPGTPVAFRRHLPHRETHLDARMDAIQRRPLLPVPRGVQLDYRRPRLQKMGVFH